MNGQVFCRNCGAAISDKAVICPNCGVPQKASTNAAINEAGAKRGVAILLAFFLGAFGVHKFYLGRKTAGFLYLLFCWTFIPAFLSFIDAIILLFTSDTEFNAKYGSTVI